MHAKKIIVTYANRRNWKIHDFLLPLKVSSAVDDLEYGYLPN